MGSIRQGVYLGKSRGCLGEQSTAFHGHIITNNIEFRMKGYHTSLSACRNGEGVGRAGVRKLATEETHEVGEYGLQKAVSRQMKRKKKKKAAVTDCLSHCQSMDHLQRLNAEKNDQIRRHIYEKAEFQTHNEELKQLISNPTLREHQLHLRIAQLEEENRTLKERLDRQQTAHREETQRMRSDHKAEVDIIQQNHRSTIERQYRAYPSEPKKQVYRTADTISRVEVTGDKVNYQNRTYQPAQNAQIIASKPEASPRVQVVHSPAQQQSSRTYVAGTPVYISSGRQEQDKQPITRALSPDNSKNTTSQTRIYRGESPQAITYLRPGETATSHTQAARVSSTTRQETRYEAVRSSDTHPQVRVESPSYPRQAQQWRGESFGEKDLQQIYKKYCISD